MEMLQIPAQVINLKPRADRSWKLEFETRELTGDDVKLLADNFQGEGHLLWKPNAQAFLPEEIPDGDADAGVKTPSRRLRASIMVLYKQQGAKGDPESFYRTYMQRLIEYVQSKLEQE